MTNDIKQDEIKELLASIDEKLSKLTSRREVFIKGLINGMAVAIGSTSMVINIAKELGAKVCVASHEHPISPNGSRCTGFITEVDGSHLQTELCGVPHNKQTEGTPVHHGTVITIFLPTIIEMEC